MNLEMFGFLKPNVAKMERTGNIDGLIEALRDSDTRSDATEALSRIGARAIDPLTDALSDKDALVRAYAAQALANMTDARSAEVLIRALEDEDYRVRLRAVRGLNRKGNSTMIGLLVKSLRDEDSTVRRAAGDALDELGWKPRNDVEKAHHLIAESMWGELIVLGEPAIGPLEEALNDPYDKSIRESAQEALGKIKANVGKIPMTQRLVHVFIYTEFFGESLELNEETVAGLVAATFPEQIEDFNPATGSFALRVKSFSYTHLRSITFKDKKTRNQLESWMRSVREGVHDLPLAREYGELIGTTGAYLIYFGEVIRRESPEFADSMNFIRRWSVFDGRLLIIGIFSIVPQEIGATPSALPSRPERMRSTCTECGQKMTITSEGVFFVIGAEANIVKLRCEQCDLTRFEKKADIERELGRTLPLKFTLTPDQYEAGVGS